MDTPEQAAQTKEDARNSPGHGGNKKSPLTREARSLPIAQRGVETAGQFAQLMSALMSDVIEGNITASIANSAVNAGGKLLKLVELEQKFGQLNMNSGRRDLALISRSDQDEKLTRIAQLKKEVAELETSSV